MDVVFPQVIAEIAFRLGYIPDGEFYPSKPLSSLLVREVVNILFVYVQEVENVGCPKAVVNGFLRSLREGWCCKRRCGSGSSESAKLLVVGCYLRVENRFLYRQAFDGGCHPRNPLLNRMSAFREDPYLVAFLVNLDSETVEFHLDSLLVGHLEDVLG